MMSWVIETMMLVVEMGTFLAQKSNKKNRQETQEWLHSRVHHTVLPLYPSCLCRTVTEKRWLWIRQWRWHDNVCWYVCSLWSLCWKSIFWNSFYSIKTLFQYRALIFQQSQWLIVKQSTGRPYNNAVSQISFSIEPGGSHSTDRPISSLRTIHFWTDSLSAIKMSSTQINYPHRISLRSIETHAPSGG